MTADPISWTDPHRRGGEPCVYGTRVPVDHIVDLLSDCPDEEIRHFYPSVSVTQVARIRAGER